MNIPGNDKQNIDSRKLTPRTRHKMLQFLHKRRKTLAFCMIGLSVVIFIISKRSLSDELIARNKICAEEQNAAQKIKQYHALLAKMNDVYMQWQKIECQQEKAEYQHNMMLRNFSALDKDELERLQLYPELYKMLEDLCLAQQKSNEVWKAINAFEQSSSYLEYNRLQEKIEDLKSQQNYIQYNVDVLKTNMNEQKKLVDQNQTAFNQHQQKKVTGEYHIYENLQKSLTESKKTLLDLSKELKQKQRQLDNIIAQQKQCLEDLAKNKDIESTYDALKKAYKEADRHLEEIGLKCDKMSKAFYDNFASLEMKKDELSEKFELYKEKLLKMRYEISSDSDDEFA